jgi:hypothetical protein
VCIREPVPKLEDSRRIRCNSRICHTCVRILEELWTVIKSRVLNIECNKLPSWNRTCELITICRISCFRLHRKYLSFSNPSSSLYLQVPAFNHVNPLLSCLTFILNLISFSAYPLQFRTSHTSMPPLSINFSSTYRGICTLLHYDAVTMTSSYFCSLDPFTWQHSFIKFFHISSTVITKTITITTWLVLRLI